MSVCLLALAVSAIAAERRTSFNEGWRFHNGDAAGAEQPGFDDGAWRALSVPHDWAIEGPFDRKHNPHAGALPHYGTGWYRKQFTVPAAKDRMYSVEFDGAMSNATVWLNGKELGGRPYGYSGFAFDLTPHLKPGAQNVIAVRLTPEERSSRWYPGAGIYRNVWLDETGPVRVARWGTYITTPEATAEKASISILTDLENRGSNAASVKVDIAIIDAVGKTVARGKGTAEISAGGKQKLDNRLTLAKPRLWDVDSPHLYTAITTIRDGKRVLDRYETPFGIRSIAFDKTRGFLLNGRPLKFQGVCMHHDLGALGAAVNRRATERQLQIMKSMGVNAIRTSHNPPSPEQLEYCDRLGLLVMDEAFDMWGRVKIPNGHGKYFDKWAEPDLRDMIRRDRNHPSVIMWSIGNEVLEQGYPEGAGVAKKLTAICKEEDPTRPVTAGYNQHWNAIKNGLADAVDIVGLNYKPTDYAKILKDHPDWMLLGAETASTVSSRGVYHLPVEKYEKHPSLQLTSYDVLAPAWAYIPDVEFQMQEDSPRVLGEFVWTGFDYLGEPTPYFAGRRANETDWPARSSYFGAVDLAGFPKDRYYLYQSVWTKAPMVHVLPHWNWAGREGQAIPVMCYTNADEAELFLNGKSLGRKKRGSEPVVLPVGPNVSAGRKFSSKYRLMWDVPYAAGSLKAVAYNGGKQVAVHEMRTAGAPARVTVMPDRTAIAADGNDLSFITVRIEDKDGNLCPMADNLVRFKVEGAGRIEAVDNGNAATVESFQADHRKAFSGMALVIVRSERGKPGRIQVNAASDGLDRSEALVTTRERSQGR
ncbi:MAG TPA: beta-galactosidase GalB [Bryobacteraceae bacterium]|nr:beta-galactosidase GalB [Bryobacteraceae bacterium]